jgi:heat shock protein HslJ
VTASFNFDQEAARRAFAKSVETKLADVRCPTHREAPTVTFDADGKLKIRGCCNRLVSAAHARLGARM